MTCKSLVALWAGAVLCSPGSAHAAAIVLQQGVDDYTGTSDTTIFQDYPNNSAGGFPYIFTGINKSFAARRALIRFDLTDKIAAGATITSTTLQLYLDFGRNKLTYQALRRVTADWVEGDNPLVDTEKVGQGAPARPGDATWLARSYPSSLWTEAGGDFQATNSGIAYAENYGTWVSINGIGMSTDVQFWLANPALNYGWILTGDETIFQSANRYNSSEALTGKPRLLIEYDPVSQVHDWTIY